MKRHYFIIALLFLALGAPAALRADSTYFVIAQDINGETISGTITTDGNLGSLNFTDVNSFSFGLQSPSSATGGTGSALGAPAALRAYSTYFVIAQYINGETISGTITTDGNLGSLNFTDVNSFSFGLQIAV